jgi:hypothetical protein
MQAHGETNATGIDVSVSLISWGRGEGGCNFNRTPNKGQVMDKNVQVISIDGDGCAVYRADNGDTWNGGIHFLESDSIF